MTDARDRPAPSPSPSPPPPSSPPPPAARETPRTRLRGALLGAHSRLVRRRPEAAIVLSCDPRGGSTWLGELIAAAEPSATIWEPFHLDFAPGVADLGFTWRQPIPAQAEWPEAERLVAEILAGRRINAWTGSASSVREFLAARRLVVKCCRANGLLPWMARRFDFELKPVHFLRHPFAIAASQARMGNFATDGMEAALTRGRHLEPLADAAAYIRGLSSEAERIVAMWCVVHLPALTDPEAGRLWIRMHYETLLSDPAAEMERLFGFWGRRPPQAVLARVRRASRMTQADAAGGALAEDPAVQAAKWRETWSDREIAAMAAVLAHFGIEVYGEDPAPRSAPVPVI